MSLRIAFVCLLFLPSILLHAQNEQSDGSFMDYIDAKQKQFSDGVVTFFGSVDKTINNWMDEPEESLSPNELLTSKQSVDLFFKSEKYIDETQSSFLRIRLGSLFQTKESTDFSYKIRAHIPLSQTKRNFQIFFDDVE